MESEKYDDLYQQAEKRLNKVLDENIEEMPEEASIPIRELFHKLHVQQIELEMQNEELRKSQSLLQASEEKYSELYDSAPVSYVTFNKDGKIINANQTTCENFHTKKEQLLNTSFYNLIKKEDRDTFYLHLRETFRLKSTHSCELRIRNDYPCPLKHDPLSSSNSCWVLLKSVSYENKDGKICCRTVITDITLQKEKEKRLQKLVQEKSLILDNANEMIAYYDDGHNLIWANKRYEEETGLSLAELQSKKCFHAWQKEGVCTGCPVSIAMKTGKHQRAELRLKSHGKSGRSSSKTWLVSAAPAKNKDGKIIGAIIMAFDITELKKARKEAQYYQSQLRKLNFELFNAIEEEREKISRELHDELGQELTAINLNLNLIKSCLPEGIDDKVNDRLNDTKQVVDNIMDQIHEISLELRPLMLDDLGLSEALKHFIEQFEKRTDIATQFNSSGLNHNLKSRIRINIYRVIQEALNNIAKHSQADKVEIHLSKNAQHLEVLIEDNGVGISRENEATHSNNKNGMGILGMRERIESMHGEFNIESQKCEGTRIMIKIPLEKTDG